MCTQAEPADGGVAEAGYEHGDGSGRGTLILDSHAVIRYGDACAARLLDLPQSELAGRPVVSLIPELDSGLPGHPRSRSVRGVRPAEADGEWRRFRAVSPSGRSFDLDVSLSRLCLSRMRPVLVGLRDPGAHHVSGRDDMERLLRSLEAAEDMALVTDREGVICYVNAAAEALTGYAAADLLGRTPEMLHAGRYDEGLRRGLGEFRQFRGILTSRRKGGEIYRQETDLRPFLDREGRVTHFVLTGRDISHHVQDLERLEHLAYHDYLTGLPNRALFLDRLGQARAYAARSGSHFALLYLDLDGFKDVNDQHGHPAGDALLRSVAEGLASVVREEDTIARMGGDEFACLLQGVLAEGSVRLVCEKLLAVVRERAAASPAGGAVTASIGVALYPRDAAEEAELMQWADRAMYRAKRGGGDQCWCACDQAGPGLPGETERILRWRSAKWR